MYLQLYHSFQKLTGLDWPAQSSAASTIVLGNQSQGVREYYRRTCHGKNNHALRRIHHMEVDSPLRKVISGKSSCLLAVMFHFHVRESECKK